MCVCVCVYVCVYLRSKKQNVYEFCNDMNSDILVFFKVIIRFIILLIRLLKITEINQIDQG